MFLKRIDIQGFKSFTDKTVLELEQGITAVVGPNGSGKSNVADAVRWVLGEQSVKILRGSKMEDVIFTGTQNRKPLNFAEVSLILDNTDKSLSVDYSEVCITRRIYRSGESEYYINKAACRLKDIRQLFMDTGVGRDGYSIIGQGRIDEILNSRSEDRRNVFEEAAGIMKYKTRKQETEKKLDSTKQNLVRINDIISELENQLGPLKEQSDKAKKYLELAEKLKVLDINLFIENYSKLKSKLETTKTQYEEVKEVYEKYKNNLDETDQTYNKIIEDKKNLENDITSLNQQIFDIEKKVEKINSEIVIAQEKVTNSKLNKDRISKDNVSTNEKLSLLESELEQRKEKEKELESNLIEINNFISDKEKELDELDNTLNKNLSQIEDLKSEIVEKHNQISTKKGSVSSTEVFVENIKQRKVQIDKEISGLQEEYNNKKEQVNEEEKSIQTTKEILEKSRQSLNDYLTEKESVQTELDNNTKSIEQLKETINKKTSRYTLLCDMDKEYEGFNKSVKNILKECEKSSSLGSGIHGALAQLIDVSKQYEVAIEVALGGMLQNIVTDDEKSAQKIIDFLKRNKFGRATFLPLTSVKSKSFKKMKKELLDLKGVIGTGADLVKHEDKYSNIVNNLLGKVLVVDNIKNAVNIAQNYKYSFKIVTLEGEVLSPGGSISGGSINKSTNLLSRSREIEELSEEIKSLNTELNKLNDKNKELNHRLEQINTDIEKENNIIKEKEILLATQESELKQSNESIDKYNERLETLKMEQEQLCQQQDQALSEIQDLNSQINELLEDVDNMTKETETNQQKYNEEISLRDNILNEITQEKIKHSSINQELTSVKENIERVNKEINEINNQIGQNKEQIEAIESDIVQQQTAIENKNNELEECNKLKENLLEDLHNKNDSKNKLDEKMQEIHGTWKDYNAELNNISDKKNKLQLNITKNEMEIESLQNRIWEEYELTYSKCLEYKQDISQFGNPNKAINDIKSQINSLGNINVSSIEEYSKVKERFEFMSKQKEDLEEAEKGLKKVINDMTRIMKSQFIEQFEIINDNFNKVFKELFGGGRAYLKLTDQENVLESGVEIEAQPPGKKLQNLSLLSGGERALTGIAILFAMLKVRPTPFCVLDEIEAALDDGNVYRFGDYIKKFTDTTQFLVITHRRGTMEASDSIYGVTMQEEGVSKLVSIKLSDEKVS